MLSKFEKKCIYSSYFLLFDFGFNLIPYFAVIIRNVDYFRYFKMFILKRFNFSPFYKREIFRKNYSCSGYETKLDRVVRLQFLSVQYPFHPNFTDAEWLYLFAMGHIDPFKNY